MGAVLGLAAWGRTQEKLGGANNGGAQIPATGFQSRASTLSQPQAGYNTPTSSFDYAEPAPTTNGVSPASPITADDAATGSFSGSGVGRVPTTSAPVVSRFGSKPGPVPGPDPVL
jgi:hypothetical protein